MEKLLSIVNIIDVNYYKLCLAAVLPVLTAMLFYILERSTPFAMLSHSLRQFIIGVVFGLLAIYGTEYGIPINGAQINCRDAAVLTAGLMFGGPAGILAGFIGGIERWIAVAWGIGTYTRVACSVSTIIAGFFAAAMRKYMFENKKPTCLISFAIGVVMEIFHLTMVFVTNMSDPETAIGVVSSCTVPMIVANAISVWLAVAAVTLLSGEKQDKEQNGVRISQTIQRWLLIAVILAFAVTTFFIFKLQDRIAITQTDQQLSVSIKEVSADVDSAYAGNKLKQIPDIAANRHLGNNGYTLLIDTAGNVVSYPVDTDITGVNGQIFDFAANLPDTTFSNTINGTDVYCRYNVNRDYYIVSVLPVSEAVELRNIALYVNTFMEVLVFAVLFLIVYMLIKRVVVNQIRDINVSLARITCGDLNETVNVRSNEEFASLSDDINSTVAVLKIYIEEASAKIDKELEFAKSIQTSALPNVFPAFPKRRDFDIYASMNTAKEVGGDFYDFYLTDTDKLNFLIADVSGKGIPAAMFMMRAKTELKTLTEADVPINEVFTTGNHALCEGNDAGMFVTAWQGGINLKTGLVTYVNAGHNPPLVKHADGKFEYLKARAGFVLAGMDGFNYKTQELQLEPGDAIFLYTDGVTEATDAHNELFGDDRLLESINAKEFSSMKELCEWVKKDVDAFVGEAPQFDDITMVAFKFIGKDALPEIRIPNSSLEDITRVTEFVDEELNKIGCPQRTVTQINIAIDEIFSNIVKYGYKDKSGSINIRVVEKAEPHKVYIRFEDEGIPYNPLTNTDPDITLSSNEREFGGLGILIVKKLMDDVKYKYEGGKNVLSIVKNL